MSGLVHWNRNSSVAQLRIGHLLVGCTCINERDPFPTFDFLVANEEENQQTDRRLTGTQLRFQHLCVKRNFSAQNASSCKALNSDLRTWCEMVGIAPKSFCAARSPMSEPGWEIMNVECSGGHQPQLQPIWSNCRDRVPGALEAVESGAMRSPVCGN